MAWNEPGDKKNDPWAGGGRDQGPPDLDEVIRRIKQRFGGIFGGGTPRGAGTGGSLPGVFVVIVAIVAWLAYDMIYIVEPADRGVVLRFGKFVNTLEPGPNWAFPRPIDTVMKVNIDEVRNVEVGYRSLGRGTSDQKVRQESLMLTRDENIVDVKFAVQYKVLEARDYLFNVKDPDATLQQATESAVREIVGKSNMDFVLTEGRSDIANRARSLIQEILDRYKTGLSVIQVTMQDAQPPDEVQDAFFDAIKAREDEQRVINEAEAYSNDVLPRARGAAARLMEEANGYKAEVVARSQGEASRFLALLTEYEKAPVVTRERLYIESMESVLSNTSKVMLDVKSGNNLLYVPLDRLISRDGSSAKAPEPTQQEAADAAAADKLKEEQRQRADSRRREGR
ncbi:MAG: membrane protease subunit HflK [Gammaproteobacteria bacterium]|nr:MAG: membrane protease subunit HflK [Gammaproteobacteria bacterium]TND01745.1 MAG: membrane protease subunit HflK [Gammaproteobacteria bacterium]